MYLKKYIFSISFTFLILLVNVSFSQNQKESDSLIQLYKSGDYKETELEILNLIANEESKPDRKLEFANSLIKKASVDSVYQYLYNGHLQKGNALRLRGDYEKALEAYFNSLSLANLKDSINDAGAVSISIADAYSEMGNSNNAEKYYTNGINLLRNTNDSLKLATALSNAGDEYFYQNKFDLALQYFEESGSIFRRSSNLIGTAYSMGNVGMVYAEQGKDKEAEQNITEAIQILEKLKDYYPISVYLTFMSDIYLKKNDWPAAVQYAKRSLDLAQEYGLKDQISDANLKLSELYEHVGNYKISSQFYKDHIKYRDSVLNIKNIEAMADLRTNYEVGQKQAEVDLLETKTQLQTLQAKRQRNFLYATGTGLFLTFLLAMGWFRRYRYIKRTNLIIEEERKKSDHLLLNILPEETAVELKQNGKVQAKKFDSVSVLFTDFKEFTQIADNLPPEKVVESVGYYFSKFDEIIEKHGLEKIKTIGDAYMCAGGLPYPSEDHALQTIQAGLEIVTFVEECKHHLDSDLAKFEVRVGVNTGPVVAGVVGSKKFAYDIWGDTVNIAARMESNSEVGKVNISENTYTLIKEDFTCEFRGEIDVKNKGKMKMYFVKSQVQRASAKNYSAHF